MHKIALSLVVIVACCLIPSVVFAHTLESDGPISATIHVAPEHRPISGKQTTYELFFADTTKGLSLARCDCKVTIERDGKTVATQTLQHDAPLHAQNLYTFEQPGEYGLTVTGKPQAAGAFDDFSLVYEVEVYQAPLDRKSLSPYVFGIGLVAVIGAGLALSIRSDKPRIK